MGDLLVAMELLPPWSGPGTVTAVAGPLTVVAGRRALSLPKGSDTTPAGHERLGSDGLTPLRSRLAGAPRPPRAAGIAGPANGQAGQDRPEAAP
jgi:hypothetical protein